MKASLVFKNDKFRKARGGHSRWLLVSCEKCKAPVLAYQKDGPGILKRLYFDRIAAPRLRASVKLSCKQCKTVLGIPMVYRKEKRFACRLFAGAVIKKIIKTDALEKIRLP